MQELGIFNKTKNLPNSGISMPCLEDFYIQFKAKIALNPFFFNYQKYPVTPDISILFFVEWCGLVVGI
jgi:hypothetical protein